MEKSKLRKIVLSGHGYSGLEAHYDSPTNRSGMDVLTFNKKKDPLAIPQKLTGEVQRMKYYFMLLFSMISQEDEKYLTDRGDAINSDLLKDEGGDSDSEVIAEIMALSQKVFVTKIEIDEDNSITIGADYEMLDGRIKNYSTVKIGAGDEFPRYYDMIAVGRQIFADVSKYVFSDDKSAALADVKEVLMQLLPDKSDEIREMDEDQRRELYRDYLEQKGYIVIGEEDTREHEDSNDLMDEDDIVTGNDKEDPVSEQEKDIPPIPGEEIPVEDGSFK